LTSYVLVVISPETCSTVVTDRWRPSRLRPPETVDKKPLDLGDEMTRCALGVDSGLAKALHFVSA
jgi:hypothetical protein